MCVFPSYQCQLGNRLPCREAEIHPLPSRSGPCCMIQRPGDEVEVNTDKIWIILLLPSTHARTHKRLGPSSCFTHVPTGPKKGRKKTHDSRRQALFSVTLSPSRLGRPVEASFSWYFSLSLSRDPLMSFALPRLDGRSTQSLQG